MVPITKDITDSLVGAHGCSRRVRGHLALSKYARPGNLEIMAGQPGPAPAQHLPHPPEIAGFMIRAYENPLISLMLGRLLNPAISAPGRFDGGS